MRADNADVVIVGAGVIGCAIAREVAASGASVVVVERGRPGAEASGAAAGLLTPQSHASAPGPFVELARSSLALYPDLARELAEETSIDVGLRLGGAIRVAAGEIEEKEISDLYAWQNAEGWRVQKLDTAQLSKMTNGSLGPAFRAGVEFPDEGSVDCRLLVRALYKSAQLRGARFRLGESVVSAAISGNRCTGVVTAAGTIGAPAVINAAGSWAALVPGLAGPAPVRPVRGQIVELVPPDPAFPFPVSWNDFYAVPRAGGLLLGSTQEEAGFEKRVTARGVALLLDRGLRLLPGLSSAEISGVWAGLRPATPDGLPVLGRTSVGGLFVAEGHFRNGILLAPVTARILSALVRGRESPVSIEPFRPGRFDFALPKES